MARANCPYALGFRSLDREVAGLTLPVTGRLPDWLSGSLFRTGPAKFEIGRQSYTHWFDGLAMLHGFHFNGDTVSYSNRFVRSHSFCEAMDQGRIARGEFMTDPCRTMFGRVMTFFNPKPGDNTNVNVSVLDEQLVALTETPLPIRFDPRTLETMGNIGFDSAVKGQVSTAHPHSDGASSYSYTIDMGRRSTYRLFTDKNGSQSVLAELPVQQPSYMHSFGMSEHYLILTEFPLRVNPLRLAFSSQPFIRNYRWDPKLGTMLTVIDKIDGSIVARARAAPCFGFHHVNAYESDGALFVDLLAYPNAEIIEQLRLDRLRAGEPITVTAILTTMSFASVYPLYIQKAEKKGRTKKEVDEIILWLTRYTEKQLQAHIEKKTDLETFYAKAHLNPSRALVKGVICGVRVEEIKEPTMQAIRYLDKLIRNRKREGDGEDFAEGLVRQSH